MKLGMPIGLLFLNGGVFGNEVVSESLFRTVPPAEMKQNVRLLEGACLCPLKEETLGPMRAL